MELAKGQFSRWARANITENDFAEENIDYWGFDINVEGNKTVDYTLTATFAKKLAMTSNSERGEQAREYFIKVEDQLKKIAERIREQQAPVQQITVQQPRVTLDELLLLSEVQAKTRYNIGRGTLLEVADEAGAVVMIGSRKRCYHRIRLDEYFGLMAR